MDAKKLVGDILGTWSQLREERRRIEPVWREITDYLYPRRSGWDWEPDARLTAGRDLFDGAPIAAHNKLADGLFGWLVSPAIDWMEIVPLDRKMRDDKAVMTYCRDLEMYLYEVYQKSNFYDALAEDFADCSALGTSVIYVDEAKRLGRPVYTPIHLREVYISENELQDVDTLYREFEMTNRQLLAVFGDALRAMPDRAGTEAAKAAEKAPEARVRVLHAQYPRGAYFGGDRVASDKPMASVYILLGAAGLDGSVGGGLLLENGGTNYRKFEAWRFRKASGQVYGTSPAMDAIHDIKMINLQSKTMADTAQLAARPPISAPESMRGKLKIAPGAISYRVGDEEVKPIITSLSYPLGIDSMVRREQVIREHFKTDFFMAISSMQASSRQRTATEVEALKAESAAVLGSVVGRATSERIDPMVRLTIAIEREAGRLPEPPRGMDPKVELNIRYIGPLAQSQRKYLRVQGISQGLAAAFQLAQADPTVPFNFDLNGSARELAVANGFPYELLTDPATVKRRQEEFRKAQAEAAEREAQREDMMAASRGTRAVEPGSLVSDMRKREGGA